MPTLEHFSLRGRDAPPQETASQRRRLLGPSGQAQGLDTKHRRFVAHQTKDPLLLTLSKVVEGLRCIALTQGPAHLIEQAHLAGQRRGLL